MNPLTRLLIHILVAVFALTSSAKMVKAQDPVQVDPEHYKVLYENAEVRVLKYDDTPGHLVPKHSHQHPYVVYVVTPALRQFFKSDCSTKDGDPKLLTPDKELKPTVPVTHCESNIGVTDTHLVIVELKKQQATATPAPQR